MNIVLASDVLLNEVIGRPITLVCEIVETPDGVPKLRSKYPYELQLFRTAKGESFIRLERQSSHK